MSDEKKPGRPGRGLGRGLGALMADVTQEDAAGIAGAKPSRPDQMIPVEQIQPNPDQPRRGFSQENLQELAESIREKGVIQPLILRRHPAESGAYQIVAGERRWRAAQLAQLHEVPALLRDYNDVEVLEIAIIENIQRADLNPLEEASGYQQLMDRFGHTQKQVSDALGKSRSHIANLLRLLNLPEEVQDMVRDGQLSAGHARALVTCENAVELARKVVAGGMSVRETEKLAKAEELPSPAPKSSAEADPNTVALERDLSAALGMRLRIEHARDQQTGRVTIKYKTLEELDGLCAILGSARS